MSDAKQRYTVIYYSELLNSDAVDSPAESKNAESKNPTLLIELQSDTTDIVTSGINCLAVTFNCIYDINKTSISFSGQIIMPHKHLFKNSFVLLILLYNWLYIHLSLLDVAYIDIYYYFAFVNKFDFLTGATAIQETKPTSKARQCLTQKLELLADQANNTSRSVSEGSKKKSRLM